MSAGYAGPPLLAAIALRELAVLGGLAEPIVPTELAEPIVPVELAAAEQAGRLSALRRGRPDLLS
jgi:hypothetical protein